MPNRIIRDGILTSEKVDLLSEPEELFFRRLLNIVDDYGKYSANPKLLLSACYPLRTDSKTLTEISLYLEACKDAGVLRIYKIKNAAFLQTINFRQRLRTMVSKWPGENGQMTDICQTDDGHTSDICQTNDGHLSGNGLTDVSSSRPKSSRSLLESEVNPKSSRSLLEEPTGSSERSTVSGMGLVAGLKKILAVAGDSEETEKKKPEDPYVTPFHLEQLQLKPGYRRLLVAQIAEEARADCKAKRMKLSFLVKRLDWERDKQFAAAGAKSAAEGQRLKKQQRAALEKADET